MLINKVIINNFFCFVGENELAFEKGLNIISSPNSGGKSQLFNAFYWAFFDQIYIDNEIGKKDWRPSVNIVLAPDALIKNDNFEGKIKTSVEIILDAESPNSNDVSNELVRYTFTRTVIYEKSKNITSVYSKPELIISYVEDGETKILSAAYHNSTLERIFPISVRKFMWYQGETMDELYDFSHPSTLKNAIREISYYPIYDNMEKIVRASKVSISKKVEKELRLKNQLSAEQGKVISEINTINSNIEDKSSKINDLKQLVETIDEDIAKVEAQFRNYDKYQDIKNKLEVKEAALQNVKELIEQQDSFLKEKLVQKWMLNGCNEIINSSSSKLDLIQLEIQSYVNTTNPIPMSLPGPEYVQRMLNDKRCYICERDVQEGTDSYEALKKRLDDFQKDTNYKNLQENFTDLNKAKHNLQQLLPEIREEIKTAFSKRDELINKRNKLVKEIRNIIQDSGNDSENIKSRGRSAENILNKLNSLKNEKSAKIANITYFENEISRLKDHLVPLESKKSSFNIASGAARITESIAEDYISFFVKAISVLNQEAYKKFINDLQEESNRLYSLYLGGKPQGKIVIDQGVCVLDFENNDLLTNLNTAELVAQKLAVANSFLSLSEKVKNKSYPIVADAPTSDFDPNNTINLTMNIGKSFEQMIILSKDYISIKDSDRDKLIKEADVVKFYELINDKIDNAGSDSRVNKKTYIKLIK